MSKIELFTDTFEISDIDPHGKKFDRVSRISATAEARDIELTLDVNTEIYPLEPAQKLTFLLASTIVTDSKIPDKEAWRDHLSKNTLADEYDYVMYGKVYKFDEISGSKCSVYASFGGLLMCLAGDYRALQDLNVGQDLYVLMRK